MSQPKVSVIIPCYNAEKYLKECMDLVVTQTLRDIEVVCINDGSTDFTLSILQEYQRRDSRIVLIDQQNLGVSAARNNGIHKATGEYVIFMDPDDFYPSHGILETLYSKASHNKALICGGSFSCYDDISKVVSTRFAGDAAKYTFKKEGFIKYSDYQFDFGYHRFLYDREFLISNNIFFPPYTRFQDPPFFVTAMIAAGSFYAIPDVVYRYRVGNQQPATSWPPSKLQDMIRGHLDDLNISAEYHLAQLHAQTVRHFEDDSIALPILNSLKACSKETLALIVKVNAAIRPELLDEAGMELLPDGHYIVRYLSELMTGFSEQFSENRFLLGDIQASASYRIGRFITFIPRKISGGIRCCIENGFSYTVKLAFKRILRLDKT